VEGEIGSGKSIFLERLRQALRQRLYESVVVLFRCELEMEEKYSAERVALAIRDKLMS
jgi:Ni2+-binding GTPase involved in maturation of urease and hydrogenase